jgi:hypothetical protein
MIFSFFRELPLGHAPPVDQQAMGWSFEFLGDWPNDN